MQEKKNMRLHQRSWLRSMIVIALLAAFSGPGCGSPDDEIIERNGALRIGNCPEFDHSQVCGCDGTNFTGACVIFTLDTKFYADLSRFREPAVQLMNDRISSLVVGGGAVAKYCQHPGLKIPHKYLDVGRPA